MELHRCASFVGLGNEMMLTRLSLLAFLPLQCTFKPVQYRPIIRLFCESSGSSASGLLSVNLSGLKKEVVRKSQRLFKKVVQANERVNKAVAVSSTNEQEDEIEIDILRLEAAHLSAQLKEVKDLEEQIQSIKSTADARFPPLLALATKYNITDSPPPLPERGPKKVKASKAVSGPRLPYTIYRSLDNLEIRVGRRAEDNDELSCNPEHRDGPDWWLHVSGHPGSHVVIRCHDDELPLKYKESLKDAAVLAAKNSKAAASNAMAVSYTRCRNVSKPPGAKAGLVHLRGEVGTVRVNLKAEKERLSRLEGQLESKNT